MRTVVTGGCGYVGAHVVRALAGHEIVVVDDLSSGDVGTLPKDVTFVRADIADPSVARALANADALVHCAGKIAVAESVTDPRAYYRANVIAGLSLFERAIDAGIKTFVFSSSAAVYGDTHVVPITEDHALAPSSPYGESKRVLEAALAAYEKAYGIRWCALRYFNAAGASEGLVERHEPETHLVPLAVGAALGKRPPLLVFGDQHDTPDGTCVRDYVHVVDLADAHARAIDHLARGGESGAINLGTGRGVSVREVIAEIERATKREVPHAIAPAREGDPPVLVASNEKARRVLGWKPSRDLATIVADVVRFGP